MPDLTDRQLAAARSASVLAVTEALGIHLIKKGARETCGPCPVCRTGRDRFVVWPSENRWWCRRCERSGDAIALLMAVRHLTFVEAVEALAGGAVEGQAVPLTPAPRPEPRLPLPELHYLLRKAAALYVARLWELGDGPRTPLRYLRAERRWSDATIRRAGLGYCGTRPELVTWTQAVGFPIQIARDVRLLDETRQDREHLSGRIVFPAVDARGQVIHLSGRRFAYRGGPKYKDLAGIASPLYGLDSLVPGSAGPVLVAESQADRVTLLEWGYEALCTGGTGVTFAQADALRGLHRPVLFVGQNDEASRVAVERAIALVGRGRVIWPEPDHKDVSDQHRMGREGQSLFDAAFRALINKEIGHGVDQGVRPRPGP